MVSDICRSKKGRANCPVHGNQSTLITPAQEDSVLEALYQAQVVDPYGEGFKSLYRELPDSDRLRYGVYKQKRALEDEWEYYRKHQVEDWKQYEFLHPKKTRYAEETYLNPQLEYLSPEAIHALKVYSTNNYKWVNGYLSGADLPVTSEDTRDFSDLNPTSMSDQDVVKTPIRRIAEQAVAAMDKAFAEAPLSEEPRILYRGVKPTLVGDDGGETFLTSMLEKYTPGAEVTFDTYTSTSDTPTSAAGYGTSEHPGLGTKYSGVIFEMKTRKGVSMRNIALFSRENEILLPRNTKWKVVGAYPRMDYRAKVGFRKLSRPFTVIQLVEVE
jgi:hypothetical protein